MKAQLCGFALASFLIAGCAASRVRVPVEPTDLALRGVRLVDSVAGTVSGPQDVLVRGGRIVAVHPSREAASEARQVIDGQGKYLMPGLWDMHVHWYDETSLPLFTLNGVTGIRMMRGEVVHYAWRAKGIEGTPAAPRMHLASPLVDGTPPASQPSFEVDTPARAREVVSRVADSAADFLKVYDKLPRDAYLALVEEATRRDVRVEGHVPIAVSWQEAAALGVQRSFEHLHSLPIWAASDPTRLHRRWRDYYAGVDYNRGLSRDDRLESASIHADAYDNFDPARLQDLSATLRSKRIWQAPTCILWQARDTKLPAEYEQDPRMRLVPGWMRGFWSGWLSQDPEVQAVEAGLNRRRTAYCLDRIRDFQQAGVPLLAGTDVMMPYVFAGTGLHDELALMVQAGLTPAQALVTAGAGPAEFMGRDDVGNLRVGALADLVLLDADPLADIQAVRRIHGIVAGGQWIGPVEREQALARIARITAAPQASSELARTVATSGLDAAFAHYAASCPAEPEVRDCGGFNIAYEMSQALSQGSEKARLPDLVAWVAGTLAHDPEALFWVAEQYLALGRREDAVHALDALARIAPGNPLVMDMLVGARTPGAAP